MRKLIQNIVLIGLLLISCTKEPYDYENDRTSYYKNLIFNKYNDSTIICVTFNIQLGFNAFSDPWDKSQIGANEEQLQNITHVLKQISPDIIALQEVPRNRFNAEIKDFLERLAENLDMNYAFGAHGFNDPYGIYPVHGEWGNAILTKYQIQNICNKEIENIDKWQKRSMIDVELMINDSVFLHALSLHYIPIQEGIPNTANYLHDHGKPIILMGDFNYMGEISELKEIGLADSDSNYIIHSIDRILYSDTFFETKEIGSLADTNYTSDHPANYSILKLKN